MSLDTTKLLSNQRKKNIEKQKRVGFSKVGEFEGRRKETRLQFILIVNSLRVLIVRASLLKSIRSHSSTLFNITNRILLVFIAFLCWKVFFQYTFLLFS